jgi:hypothetical protein
MPRLIDHGARLCKLEWADLQLRVLRDNITPEIAPGTARKIRSTLKSLAGAINHTRAMARRERERATL